MPIFEYKCQHCGQKFEELIFGDNTPPSCPICASKKTSKLISRCWTNNRGKGCNTTTPSSDIKGGCSDCTGGNCSNCH